MSKQVTVFEPGDTIQTVDTGGTVYTYSVLDSGTLQVHSLADIALRVRGVELKGELPFTLGERAEWCHIDGSHTEHYRIVLNTRDWCGGLIHDLGKPDD